MVTRDGRSIGDALSVVTAAEAPFVNVPCHINIRDGSIALTNNDHTLLGLRASTYLMPYLPEQYRLLPLVPTSSTSAPASTSRTSSSSNTPAATPR